MFFPALQRACMEAENDITLRFPLPQWNAAYHTTPGQIIVLRQHVRNSLIPLIRQQYLLIVH